MKIKLGLLILGTILLGAFLRLYQPCFFSSRDCLVEDSMTASIVPPALNWDEVSLGYNAYSILKTGKDEWGRRLPLSFEAFGDFKLPGYIYTSIPFIATLGLNAFSVRLPSMAAGIFSLLFLYLITKKLTNSQTTALLATFLLAISPWHIFLSRIALEANLALAFFLAGLYFFLMSLERPKNSFISIIFFGAAIFTYNSARVFIPLFILLLVAVYWKRILENKKAFVLSAVLLLLIFLVGGYFAFFQDSSSRYFWVAIIDQGAINDLNQARVNSHFAPFLTDLLYNRYSYFLERAFFNYFSHLSPQYLFLQGGSNYQFSVPGFGLLYIIEAPFIILGLLSLRSNKRSAVVILSWLLLAPIPSAITREAPHVLRSLFMLGSLQIISALGIYKAFNLISKKELRNSFLLGVILLFLINLTNYYHYYLSIYPQKYSQSWQYGYKETYLALEKKVKSSGSKNIYISKAYGEPHIFYLFYNSYDPLKYQTNPTLVRYPRSNWRWVDRLDTIHFINDWEVREKLKGVNNAILITSPGNYPKNFTLFQSIRFLDGKDAFEIVESK